MPLSLDRWIGKVAIVTGASAGIGENLVKDLVEAGLKVVGVARRVEAIEKIAQELAGKKGKLYPFKADLTKEQDILALFKHVGENIGPVHILINNAGVFYLKHNLLNITAEEVHQTLDLNLFGLTIATREAVNSMIRNKIDGHIVHVNSTLGHRVPSGVANLNVYSASKCAVTALTETLRNDLNLEKSKIKISSVSPGYTKTEMTVYNKDNSEQEKEYFKTVPFLESQDIVDGILYALSTPPHVQVHELTIKPVGERV